MSDQNSNSTTEKDTNYRGLNFDELDAFIDAAELDINKWRIQGIVLNAGKILGLGDFDMKLAWRRVQFGSPTIHDIPDDRRGVYAFVISHEWDSLPAHGYIMYIGIAGTGGSGRSLRQRYFDYLNQSKVVRRPKIVRMISLWHRMLYFHFASVDDTVSDAELRLIESRLNTALLPPCSINDIEASTRRKRAAF